jgi:adiponectin receptor
MYTDYDWQFRLPERLSPGTFDIWGASHQIFHVAILSALCSHGTALIKAFTAFHSLDLCEIHRAYRSGQGMV